MALSRLILSAFGAFGHLGQTVRMALKNKWRIGELHPSDKAAPFRNDVGVGVNLTRQYQPKIARYSSKTLRCLQSGVSVNGDQVTFDEAAAAAATVQFLGGQKLTDFSDEYDLSRNVRYGVPDYALNDWWGRLILVQVTRANRPDSLLSISMEKVIKSTGWLQATSMSEHHRFVIAIWVPDKALVRQLKEELSTIAQHAKTVDSRFEFLFLVPKKSIAPKIFPPQFGHQKYRRDLTADFRDFSRLSKLVFDEGCDVDLPDLFEL